jgi:UDP-glucose 4-epimerase
MKTVWVTGIAGFLGGAVARRLASAGWRVAGAGNAPPGWEPDVSTVGGRPAFVPGMLSPEGFAALQALTGPPDAVIHAAGSGAVGPSFADPYRDFCRAVTGTAVVLDHLRRAAPAARLVLSSSAAVYGVRSETRLAEGLEPAPASPYGAHKQMAEVLCRQASQSFGQPTAVVRFFSLYGPPLRKQLLWDLSRRLAERPERLVLGGSGEETRDLLFIDDAVRLIERLAEDDAPFRLVNGGTGRASSVRQIAAGLIARLSPETELAFTGETRKGDPRDLVADTARLAALGFDARVSLDEGLDRYAAWFREQGMPA